jgi:HAE1 family hydrophobic/amphiphilic exporter-1
MTALARLSLRFKAVTMLLVALLLAAGTFAVTQLNQELFPSFDVPFLVVTAAQPDASPSQVAEGVAAPIEDVFRATEDLASVSSTSLEGLAIISAEYEFGTDMSEREREIRDGIEQARLPSTIERPTVERISLDSFPVYTMAVFGDDLDVTERFVEEELTPRLATLDGIAEVAQTGGSAEVISVEVDPAALAASALTIGDVEEALRDANVSVPVGGIAVGGTQLPVRVAAGADDLGAVASTPIPVPGAAPVALSDVASVTLDEQGEGTTISRTDGKASIGLEILKEQDANTVATVGRVEDVLDEIDPPEGIEVAEVTNQAPQIRHAVSDLAREAGLGGIMAILMILVFLRSLRTTLIAAVSIPLSLLVAFILMGYEGITLNILTLGAMSVAAGRVIDDAIVVIENIHRLLEEGRPRSEAVLEGTSQMVPAITASTLTTVAVFLPLAFVGGLVGEVFAGFALTITFALLASLLVAVTVVPVLAELFLRSDDSAKGDDEEARFKAVYRRPLIWALGHRKATIGVSVVLLLASFAAASGVPTNLFPAAEVEALAVNLTGPPGAGLEAMSEQVAAVEAELADVEGIERFSTVVGTSDSAFRALAGGGGGSNSATITVALDDGADDDEVTTRIEEVIADGDLPGAVSASSGFGDNSVSVQVTGEDFQAITEGAERLGTAIAEVEGLEDVRTNVAGERPELALTVDPARAAAAGLDPASVADTVRSLLSTSTATALRVDGELREVVVSVDPSALDGPEALAALTVAPGLTLGDVATVGEASTAVAVTRYDGARSAEVSGIITGSNVGQVNMDVQAAIDDTELPAGVDTTLGGAAEAQSDSFGALGIAMLVAVALVYLTMVATFGSLLTPFVILLTLPLAAIGAFPALLVTGRELGLPAMLGLLMLIGIVVTNAIVMLEFVERLKEQGLSTRDALIEGAQTRLRPILMTAIVTILALTPLALGLSEGAILSASLATVVIGGLLSSTILTLVVIPVAYSLIDGLRDRVHRRRHPAPAPS